MYVQNKKDFTSDRFHNSDIDNDEGKSITSSVKSWHNEKKKTIMGIIQKYHNIETNIQN